MNALRQDLRYVLRTLRGTPMLTAVITVTLALGIGATTGIFSVVNAVLLRPLPYQSSESLVELFDTQKDTRELSASYPEFIDWRDGSKDVFSDVAAVINQ